MGNTGTKPAKRQIPGMPTEPRKDIGKIVHDKVHIVFRDASDTLKHAIQRNDVDVTLYIPEPLIIYWQEYMAQEFRRTFTHGVTTFKYRNVVVLPGYEMKVVLAHRKHLYYRDKQLISESTLDVV